MSLFLVNSIVRRIGLSLMVICFCGVSKCKLQDLCFYSNFRCAPTTPLFFFFMTMMPFVFIYHQISSIVQLVVACIVVWFMSKVQWGPKLHYLRFFLSLLCCRHDLNFSTKFSIDLEMVNAICSYSSMLGGDVMLSMGILISMKFQKLGWELTMCIQIHSSLCVCVCWVVGPISIYVNPKSLWWLLWMCWQQQLFKLLAIFEYLYNLFTNSKQNNWELLL